MNRGSIVSAFVATKLRLVLIGLLVVGVTIGGAFAVGILGVPSVAAIHNTFGDVTDETTTIETELVITNPNPIGFGTDDVTLNYTISMNSIEMAYGGREGVAIGTGNSTLDLVTQMRNEAIPAWWTSHIQNDERTLIDIDATVTSGRLGRSADISKSHEIETDLISSFNSDETRPVNADSPLTDDPVLYINETRGQWGSVTEEETPIDMEFVVYNPNLEPYAITRLGYDITMNDVPVGAGETQQEYVIPSHSSETIALTTSIDTQRLDEWWVTHLDESIRGHQVSELRIEFHAVVELPTGEEITVPLEELTYEETIETDIFDEGEDVGASRDSNGDDTDADDEESTTNDGANGDETETDDESDGNESTDDEEEDGSTDDEEDDDDGILPL